MPEPVADRTLSELPALSKIPAFPPIVLRVFDLLASDEVEVRELVELITADPAFSAQILRLANSPLFGFHSRIESLQHALVILGLRRVRSLAMTVATANYMHAALKIQELYRCWRHMLACALLTEELARVCSVPEDVAYTAGLLHDLGRLGLLVAHPTDYAKLLKQAEQTAAELLDLEKKVFGADHCEVGRLLAEQWNLPEDIRIVAGRHHDPPAGTAEDLVGLTYLGCELANTLGFWVTPPLRTLSLEEVREMLPEAARSRFNPDSAQLRDYVERRIRSHDSAGIMPASPAQAAQADSEPPEQQKETPVAPATNEIQTAEGRSLWRDLVVVLVTGLIFSAVFILTYYLVTGQ